MQEIERPGLGIAPPIRRSIFSAGRPTTRPVQATGRITFLAGAAAGAFHLPHVFLLFSVPSCQKISQPPASAPSLFARRPLVFKYILVPQSTVDAPIVITSSDLVDFTVFTRKRHETSFRRDFLIRHGARPEEPHVAALATMLNEVGEKLRPLEDKLRQIDLITILPHRADILSLTAEINQFSREQLDAALQSRSGPIFDLLKKRGALTRANYERREEIARLTILLNTLPRPEAERLRTLVESNSATEVTVSSLAEEQQQDMVNLMGRMGIVAFISSGLLTLDKKKVDGLTFLSWPGELFRPLGGPNGPAGWVPRDKLPEWEENETHLAGISRKIQQRMAQRQANGLSDEEQKEFEAMQQLYLELRGRRQTLADIRPPTSVSLGKIERSRAREELAQIDLGPTG